MSSRARQNRRHPLHLEKLESRCLLANLGWTTVQNGNFSDANMWVDLATMQHAAPTPADTVAFTADGAYTVSLGGANATVKNITANDTSVTINLGGATLTASDPNADFTVSNGDITHVHIMGGGSLETDARVIVSAGGTGFGELEVSGGGTTWTARNNIIIGGLNSGGGTLKITDGANVVVSENAITVGETNSDDSTLLVDGGVLEVYALVVNQVGVHKADVVAKNGAQIYAELLTVGKNNCGSGSTLSVSSGSLLEHTSTMVIGTGAGSAVFNCANIISIGDAGGPGEFRSSGAVTIGENNGEGWLEIKGDQSVWVPDSIEIYVGDSGGTGYVEIRDSAEVEGQTSTISVGASGKGELTADGSGTLARFHKIYIGEDDTGKFVVENSAVVEDVYEAGGEDTTVGTNADSSGELFVRSGAVFRGLARVGASGSGKVELTNGGATSHGDLIVGESDGGTGEVLASNLGGTAGALNLQVPGRLFVGQAGKGTLTIRDGGFVDQQGAGGVIVGVGLGEGLVDINGGELRSTSGAIAEGADVDAGVEGRVKLHGEETSKWTSTGPINVGSSQDVGAGNVPSPGFLQVDAGLVEATAVYVYKSGTVSGKARVKVPGNKINVEGGKVAAGADGGMGTVAVFTIEGGFDSTSGGSVLTDIQGSVYGQNYDTVYVTGASELGGTLEVSVNGYLINPWQAAAGDYFMVLRSVSSLSGEFLHALPPVQSVANGSPSPGKHFSWKVVYDRSDAFDSTLVNDYGDAFLTQPWTSNGTKDVVLLIVEVDDYDPPPGHNDPPDSSPDSGSTETGTQIDEPNPGVLGNDMDPNNDILTAILGQLPLHGIVTLLQGGGYVYVPTVGYIGPDSFTYWASDGEFLTVETTVSITVTSGSGGGCSGSPAAMDDWYAATPMAAANVLENDTDPSGPPSQAVVTLVSGPSHAVSGSFSLAANGDFTYSMDSGYSGQDFFTYQFTACGQTSNAATVTLESMAQPLVLDLPPATATSDSPSITQADLDRLTREAARRWIMTGFDPASVHRMFHGTTIEVADLPGSTLGLEAPGKILIDVNAAGHGWFIDLTPRTDDEFSTVISRSERQASRGSAAYGRADALTALMHEMGHALGLVHVDGDGFAHSVMNDTLSLGTRRLPTAADIMAADEYFAELWQSGSAIRRRRW